jgi:hypothetical protein
MKIWNTYVVPRFLYGLEVQNPTKKDIKKLEQLQRKVCRQFQCLPERTSSIAVYALTGAEPIAVTLNKYCINLFFGIVRLDSTIEKQMLLWESANANARKRTNHDLQNTSRKTKNCATPAIMLINNVSFALAFADSHSSICFSIVESSLTIPKNKFIQYLFSVTAIGSAPVNA